jgi:hypothetical protein
MQPLAPSRNNVTLSAFYWTSATLNRFVASKNFAAQKKQIPAATIAREDFLFVSLKPRIQTSLYLPRRSISPESDRCHIVRVEQGRRRNLHWEW